MCKMVKSTFKTISFTVHINVFTAIFTCDKKKILSYLWWFWPISNFTGEFLYLDSGLPYLPEEVWDTWVNQSRWNISDLMSRP